LGEMYVVHFCNFDWLVKKAWMLLHPAHLTSITQNCTSFLNSPYLTQCFVINYGKLNRCGTMQFKSA
jgi:hypothetical protein